VHQCQRSQYAHNSGETFKFKCDRQLSCKLSALRAYRMVCSKSQEAESSVTTATGTQVHVVRGNKAGYKGTLHSFQSRVLLDIGCSFG